MGPECAGQSSCGLYYRSSSIHYKFALLPPLDEKHDVEGGPNGPLDSEAVHGWVLSLPSTNSSMTSWLYLRTWNLQIFAENLITGTWTSCRRREAILELGYTEGTCVYSRASANHSMKPSFYNNINISCALAASSNLPDLC